MSVLEIISTGISLLGIGQNVYDWVTGHTIINQIDDISGQIEKLNDQIFLLNNSEIRDISLQNQNIITNSQDILWASLPIQRAFNRNLLISQPITSPTKLKSVFYKNPENILFNITPIKNKNSFNLPNDPTLVPVTFSKWGQEFIGFIKIGYLSEFFDCEYEPVFLNSGLRSISFDRLSIKNVSDFAFSTKNKLVASSYDGDLYLYDLQTRKISTHIKRRAFSKETINRVTFNPKGDLIALAGSIISIWDANSGKRKREIGAPLDSLVDYLSFWDVSFSPNGSLLAYGVWMGQIVLHDLRTNEVDIIFSYNPSRALC